MRKIIFGFLAFLALPGESYAINGAFDQERAETVAEIFHDEGVTATLVVASAVKKGRFVYNEERAGQRFSPASTFKIFNTLIALKAELVTSKEAPFRWDGKVRGVEAWNQDQTLASAFKVSCVWCYQKLARRIGLSEYRAELSRLGYGNAQVGEQVDRFWLNGDLLISAQEQIDLLSKIQDYSIAFRREHVDVLRDIMVDERTESHVVYAKSGMTGPQLHVGWYVGFVEKADQTFIFAMNMKIDDVAQAPLRKDLTMRSLRALGVL